MKEKNDRKRTDEVIDDGKTSVKLLGITYVDKLNVLSFLIVVIAITTILIIGYNECKTCFNELNKNVKKPIEYKLIKKKYRIYGRNVVNGGYLNNLFTVLDRLGYERNDNDDNNWDLLWAHDYPFRTLYDDLNNLRPYQRVNHFPGCGYITNKVDLATSGLKYIPPAFKLPTHKNELINFINDNPNKLFVQKHNEHRHIKIVNISDIDLNKDGTFVQEFIDKPLLISGYKFDIGIYTIITSIDPLRAYIYNGDALLRFCPVKYYPFDPVNIDKYVVGDDYLPPWDVPDLTYSYKNLKLGMKQSLNCYLKKIGKDPKLIWDQIDDSLRVVLLENEAKLNEIANKFKSKDNFFEMMRFDFVVDDNLNVYLMEANMSPNLSSSHFPLNRHLFEQIIYNLFSLIGIGERIYKDSLAVRFEEEELMLSGDKNIAVYPEECNSDLCYGSCVSPHCQLCNHCLSVETRRNLLRAYREHVNRGDCRRIFPPSMLNDNKKETREDLEMYTPENRIMYEWFYGKCLLDPSWCN